MQFQIHFSTSCYHGWCSPFDNLRVCWSWRRGAVVKPNPRPFEFLLLTFHWACNRQHSRMFSRSRPQAWRSTCNRYCREPVFSILTVIHVDATSTSLRAIIRSILLCELMLQFLVQDLIRECGICRRCTRCQWFLLYKKLIKTMCAILTTTCWRSWRSAPSHFVILPSLHLLLHFCFQVRTDSNIANVRCIFVFCNQVCLVIVQDDWQKEKRDFLSNLSRLPFSTSGSVEAVSSSSIQGVRGTPGGVRATPETRVLEYSSSSHRSILDRKAAAYADVVVQLNAARERSVPFKVCTLYLSCR